MLVKFFATYRQIAGCKSCDVKAPQDVLALMGVLSERWPEFRSLILNGDGTDKVNRMDEMVKHLYIPTSLTEFGVPKEDLEDLVKSGMEVTRLLVNNMREVTSDDARMIYQQVL